MYQVAMLVVLKEKWVSEGSRVKGVPFYQGWSGKSSLVRWHLSRIVNDIRE